MAALTANRSVSTRMPTVEGPKRDFQVAASTTIYRGAFVGLNLTGYLTPATASTVGTTLVGRQNFQGIALEFVDNSTGAAGAKRCNVLCAGMFDHALSGAAITDIGKPVWASDDNTLTLTSGGNVFIGHVDQFVSTGNVIVAFNAMISGSDPTISRNSSIVSVAAANVVTLVYPSENPSGLQIYDAYAMVTTLISTTPTLELADVQTDGSITAFTPAVELLLGATYAAGDIAKLSGSATSVATDGAVATVTAGRGVVARIKIASGTGAVRFTGIFVPLA